MKAVILAGGLGTRLSEETTVRPKPMVEIGGRPILWHILKMYAHHGVNDFIICCGYKGYYIKEYFSNYFLHMSDVTFDMRDNRMEVKQQRAEPWRVTLVDTGEQSMTGGRLLRVAPYLQDEEAFCFTYGDGVSDLDIAASIAFHRQHGKWATLTAVRPSSRFGLLELQGGQVLSFQEKPRYDGSVVNGGFYVLSPQVMRYLRDDGTIWEQGPLQQLVHEGQLMAYEHGGFWYPMDTLRDKHYLEELWAAGQAPWRSWE
jgi:glucose-1-phosphate cytidylyltransferase